jgi:AraC-like DNA-binding protein/mannose-6-phosphate isomerase-like protein (cupin superfamily)
MLLENYYQTVRKSFIRDVQALVEELEVYNQDERYYQHWHDLRHDRKSLRAYLRNLDIRKLRQRKLILPEDMESILRSEGSDSYSLTEELIFPEKRNVHLQKHNRYSPAFVHHHDYFETFFVLRGQCVNTVGNKRMVLTEGHLCFIAPHTNHVIEVFDDSIIINIFIRRSTFDEVFFKLLSKADILSSFFMRNIFHVNSPEYIIFNIAGDIELVEHILAILLEQAHGDQQSSHIMDNQIEIFFSLLIRKYGNSPLVYEQVGLVERYWKIIAYINEHFRTVSLSMVASRFHLSLAYCSRMIKVVTGKNFTALIRDLRMGQARTMLASSATKVCDISFSLGYENQETFIRAFRKQHGISPNQYRQRCRQTPVLPSQGARAVAQKPGADRQGQDPSTRPGVFS